MALAGRNSTAGREHLSFKQRVLGSRPSVFAKAFQWLSCPSGLALLPRKLNWEAYGKQARVNGLFP